MKWLLLYTFLTPGLIAHAAPAEPKRSVDQRLEELEKRYLELEERQNQAYLRSVERTDSVGTFFDHKLRLGGFSEAALTYIHGPDTPTQTSANSYILGINIAAEFSDHIRFVTQFLVGLTYTFQNPHNNPAVTPSERQYGTFLFGALPAQSYIEYNLSPAFNFQAGLGYVPFGTALQQREPVLFRRRGGPQMASSGGATTVGIAFPLWMGVHIHGTFPVADGNWGYNAYTFSPSTDTGTLGEGLRAWWAPSQKLTVGLSGQTGRQDGETFFAHGFDLNYKSNRFGITAEYARNTENTGDREATSYYAEPFLTFSNGKYLIFAAADYISQPDYVNPSGSIADPFEKWIYGVGFNWLPISYARYRIGYFIHNYIGDTSSIGGQRRDYESIDLSAGVAF